MEYEYDLGKIGLTGYKINKYTNIDIVIKTIIKNNSTTIDFENIHGRPLICHINNKFEYDITLQLGSGTYGTVFCIETNRVKYALKEQNYGKNKTALGQMLKEAIVHFILCEQKDASSHFPKIIQIAWNPTNFFIVMEYLDLFNGGETLNNIFENKEYRNSPKYMKDACEVATKIALIIQPLQDSLKFSHGDLNFGNIYLASNKTIKLLDFGFSSVELGGKQIITNVLNKNYKPGKDLSIYTYSVLYKIDKPDYEISNPDEFKIYSYFKTILPVLNYHTTIFYEDLDNNPNNESANPATVLENLGDCSPIVTTTGGARPKSQVKSARVRTRRSARKSAGKTKKLNSRNSQYKSLGQMLQSPIELPWDQIDILA
jgi:tRNA A-37 threonylcarbamoyl transferase component Bud32